MSLKVEHNNLEEFEKTINDPETTKKISEAFAEADEQIKKDLRSFPKTSEDIIKDVVRKIRKAKTLEEAIDVLLDNVVTLYETEGIAYLIQHSLIEGSNNTNSEEVTDEEFDQMYNETNGFNATCPKDNLSCGSQNMEEFCDFMKRGSKGYSDGVIERRKKSVKSLIQDFGKLTPEIENIIDACTSVSEIENIYDEVKATIPKSNDGMIDCVDILNKVSGDKPMTDAEKLEDAQDIERHALQVKDLTEKEKIRPDVPMTPEAYEELKVSVRKRYKTGNGNKPDNK